MQKIMCTAIFVCFWVQLVYCMGSAPVAVSVGILADMSGSEERERVLRVDAQASRLSDTSNAGSDVKLDHEVQDRSSRIVIRVAGSEGKQNARVEALTPERSQENRECTRRLLAGIERMRNSNKWVPEKFFLSGLVCSFILFKLKILFNERKSKKEHEAKQQENR